MVFRRKQDPPATRPLLRAETGGGESYDDPSEDALFMLLDDLANENDV